MPWAGSCQLLWQTATVLSGRWLLANGLLDALDLHHGAALDSGVVHLRYAPAS